MRIGQENSTKTSLKQIKRKTSFVTLFLVGDKCDIGNWSKMNSLMMHYTWHYIPTHPQCEAHETCAKQLPNCSSDKGRPAQILTSTFVT